MKKCGQYPVNDFEGWPPLEKNDERDLVYFAVKKEHDMGYRYSSHNKVFTYEELIQHSITDGTNHFDYHNHSYSVEKNEDDNYDVLSNGEKIAEAIVEDDICVVDILKEKKDYVRNTTSKYYEGLYKNLFSKTRTKEYGIPSNEKEIDL